MLSPRVRLLSTIGSVCFEVSHQQLRTFEDLDYKTRKREDIFPHVHLLATVYTPGRARGFVFFTKTFCPCIRVKGRAGFLATIPCSSRPRDRVGDLVPSRRYPLRSALTFSRSLDVHHLEQKCPVTSVCVPQMFRLRVRDSATHK